MSDYNLTGLNPRDFEHLVQALAIKVIAGGVMPFGDGPDGGREATYNGKMLYPLAIDPWDGYLVIQAKFLTRPTGDSTRDGDWAINQLKQDLSKFEDTERKLPKPEYYLFVTNVVLTPVQDAGSKDKAISLLEQYKTSFELKGYDIWDYDKICRLLDGQPEIYSRYAGFITSGDVLSKLMAVLKDQQPDFFQVMSLFLQKELRNEQFVKLEQAGHTADQKTSLAHVFVDLPASKYLRTEPPENESDLNNLPLGLVSEILEAGSYVLRRSLNPMYEETDEEGQIRHKPERGRFVVVGGPGQGKSTIGQFLCQVYRVSILKDCPPHEITPEAHTVLELIAQQCQADKMTLPVTRRFPVRVVLDQFATDLAKGEINSLISFVLRQIAINSGHECSLNDLRRWLQIYPWLIVLDGLDEVPATSNRDQVLEKITEFWSQVAVLDADVLVIATTRPQGYNDDFSSRFYRHRYLSPLSKARALHYANRLAEARYGVEPARKAKVLKRLDMALEQEPTSRLMRTPLQVTIMATLVDQIGQPPQERWRLFQQYYEVIYRREMERDIPASRILQQRRADVNAIHNRVGLLLQTESELAGNSEAQLTKEKFGHLVRARIAEEGYEGEELERRVDEIIQAALQRLVFLVGLESDRIGFEIRSLQEFTAAEALMDGGDAQVRARLEGIATNAHWRNVFLFAAGKCFAERQFLRDMIISICDQLNDAANDRLAGITLSGSRLALDILEDGVAKEQPNYARSLARLALKLLELADEAPNTRLASVYDHSLENLFREYLLQRLGQRDFEQTLGAWIVILSFVGKRIGWAQDLAAAKWPTDHEQQLRIVRAGGKDISEWLADRIIALIPNVAPSKLARIAIVRSPRPVHEDFYIWFRLIRKIHMPWGQLGIRVLSPAESSNFAQLRVTGVFDDSWTQFKDLPLATYEWSPYISAIKFHERPSAETLSKELKWLSENWNPQSHNISGRSVAWPLAACISSCETADGLNRYAHLAQAGKLGQLDDWIEAETRWIANGITEDDFIHMTDDRWPYDNLISKVGFPFSCSSKFIRVRSFIPELWNSLLTIYETLSKGKMKSRVAGFIFDLLNPYPQNDPSNVSVELTPDLLKNLYIDQQKDFLSPRELKTINFPSVLGNSWIDFFEWLGNQSYKPFLAKQPFAYTPQLAEAFVKDTSKQGLLLILGSLVISGSSCPVPNELLNLERFNSNDLKRAALLLQIAKGGWTETEASQLAEEILALNSDTSIILHSLRLLENNNLSASDKALLIMAIREHLLISESEEIFRTAKPLNDLIESRSTHMNDDMRWKELGLPALH